MRNFKLISKKIQMENTNLVPVDPKQFGIEETKAVEITSGLKTILAEREVLKDSYEGVITLEITKENLPKVSLDPPPAAAEEPSSYINILE